MNSWKKLFSICFILRKRRSTGSPLLRHGVRNPILDLQTRWGFAPVATRTERPECGMATHGVAVRKPGSSTSSKFKPWSSDRWHAGQPQSCRPAGYVGPDGHPGNRTTRALPGKLLVERLQFFRLGFRVEIFYILSSSSIIQVWMLAIHSCSIPGSEYSHCILFNFTLPLLL